MLLVNIQDTQYCSCKSPTPRQLSIRNATTRSTTLTNSVSCKALLIRLFMSGWALRHGHVTGRPVTWRDVTWRDVTCWLQVLAIGPTGTGKTLAIADKLIQNMPKAYIPELITFSAKTSANQTQDLIDGKLDKRWVPTLYPCQPCQISHVKSAVPSQLC